MATRRPIVSLAHRALTSTTSRVYVKRTTPISQTARACAGQRHVFTIQQRRWHTTPPDLKPGKQYDFQGMKKVTESPNQEIIVIDVREPSEYEAGYIPNAFNIPIQSQPDAFHLAPEDFFTRFGFTKPPPENEIIMYCKAGVRSRAAAQLARQNGYERVGEYPGSWLDWQKNGGVSSKNPEGKIDVEMKT